MPVTVGPGWSIGPGVALGTGGGGASTLTIPPANSTTVMFIGNTGGIGAYAFF